MLATSLRLELLCSHVTYSLPPKSVRFTFVRSDFADHRTGSCEGRLVISDTRLTYESVNEIGDSRQWVYRDIREVSQDGPYRLQITPFLGNTHSLELIGDGLDTGQFRTLVDLVTAARVGT